MRSKLWLIPLIICLVTITFTLAAPAYSAANITGGPLSQYRFKAEASWRVGKINLRWYNDGSADKFALLYGSKPGEHKFGAVNLPAVPYAVNKFTVDFLRSDKRYFFVLIAEKDGEFVYMTDPVSAITN